MDIKNTPIRYVKCFNSPDYTSLFCVAANYNILLVNYQALNVITTYELMNLSISLCKITVIKA